MAGHFYTCHDSSSSASNERLFIARCEALISATVNRSNSSQATTMNTSNSLMKIILNEDMTVQNISSKYAFNFKRYCKHFIFIFSVSILSSGIRTKTCSVIGSDDIYQHVIWINSKLFAKNTVMLTNLSMFSFIGFLLCCSRTSTEPTTIANQRVRCVRYV